MLKPSRLLAICLLAVLAAPVNGCGSSGTTTTTTAAGSNGGTGAPTSTAPVPSTSSASQPPPTTGKAEHQEKAAEATRTRAAKGFEHHAEAAKPSVKVSLAQVSVKQQYPKLLQHKFIATCTSREKSASACECVLVKFETSPEEKGQSLAEIIAIELSFVKGVPVPSRIQRQIDECKRA